MILRPRQFWNFPLGYVYLHLGLMIYQIWWNWQSISFDHKEMPIFTSISIIKDLTEGIKLFKDKNRKKYSLVIDEKILWPESNRQSLLQRKIEKMKKARPRMEIIAKSNFSSRKILCENILSQQPHFISTLFWCKCSTGSIYTNRMYDLSIGPVQANIVRNEVEKQLVSKLIFDGTIKFYFR